MTCHLHRLFFVIVAISCCTGCSFDGSIVSFTERDSATPSDSTGTNVKDTGNLQNDSAPQHDTGVKWDTHSSTEMADADTGTGTDTATDTGTDTGADTVTSADPATGADTMTGADTATGTDTGPDADTPTEAGADTDSASTAAPGTDAATDSGTASTGDTGTDTVDAASTDASVDTASGSGPDTPITMPLQTPEGAFTFFTISDMQDGPSVGINHIRSMVMLDPAAVALIEVGDFTHNGTRAEWEAHYSAITQGIADAGAPANIIRTDATDFGDYIRLIGALGNHEPWSTNWYELWNEFLPGQRQLGVNSESDGVYFTLRYGNALFIIMDTNHPGDAQTVWLKNVLESEAAQSARWKIAFFHEPVYACSSRGPFPAGLPWVTLFETHQVDLAITGHLHTFEQMCPMHGGRCATEGQHGVVYLTASGGGTGYSRSVSETDSNEISFGDRTDAYSCSEILVAHESGWHHFCHYTV
ncbi:MAG: metallophosphoesterase, partial [Deltaproteobacteria bacterium]|nr:metallophosphoesterase [Deltaproteobacteria bacterium]